MAFLIIVVRGSEYWLSVAVASAFIVINCAVAFSVRCPGFEKGGDPVCWARGLEPRRLVVNAWGTQQAWKLSQGSLDGRRTTCLALSNSLASLIVIRLRETMKNKTSPSSSSAAENHCACEHSEPIEKSVFWRDVCDVQMISGKLQPWSFGKRGLCLLEFTCHVISPGKFADMTGAWYVKLQTPNPLLSTTGSQVSLRIKVYQWSFLVYDGRWPHLILNQKVCRAF